jgi:hypothetical protein
MKIRHMFAVAALAAYSLPVSAVPITGTASDFSYTFSQFVGGVTVSGSVAVDVTNFSTSSDFVRMTITLINTTPGATAGQNRWTAWGFGVDRTLTGGTWSDANDGGMVFASFGSLPGLSQIDVCIYGGNNCAAGNGGIAEGASDTFVLQLNFLNLTSSGFNMQPFGARFVSVGANEDSYTFYTPTTPPTRVSEPSILALMSAGLLALGFAARRRRRS